MKIISKLRLFLIYHNILNPFKKLKYEDYEISFIDDFNGDKLNEENWMTHYYWGNNIQSNNEVQWYSKDAFSLKNSILSIIIKKQNTLGWTEKSGKRENKIFNITSGLIHTGESFKQKYGRFEIRCKILSDNDGILPSFWLINPASYPPEIDIFDFSNSDKDSYNAGFIYGDDNNEKFYYPKFNIIRPVKINKWNIFTLDWEPNKLIWYFNGYKVFTYEGSGIPQTPMYVAVNVAVQSDGKLNKLENQTMLIDWVKIYKKINKKINKKNKSWKIKKKTL